MGILAPPGETRKEQKNSELFFQSEIQPTVKETWAGLKAMAWAIAPEFGVQQVATLWTIMTFQVDVNLNVNGNCSCGFLQSRSHLVIRVAITLLFQGSSENGQQFPSGGSLPEGLEITFG